MQDRIQEIRARCDAAKTRMKDDPWWVSTGTYIADVDDLLTEYDRLNDFEQSQSAKLLEKLNASERREQAAVKTLCQLCLALDKKAGRVPLCDPDCPWRGPQEAGKGEAE